MTIIIGGSGIARIRIDIDKLSLLARDIFEGH